MNLFVLKNNTKIEPKDYKESYTEGEQLKVTIPELENEELEVIVIGKITTSTNSECGGYIPWITTYVCEDIKIHEKTPEE